MTDEEIMRIARLMGANAIAELPDVGHGAAGAAHMGRFFQMRMEDLRRQEQAQTPRNSPIESRQTMGKELAEAVVEAERAAGKLTNAMVRAKDLLALLHSSETASGTQGSTPSSVGE